MKADQQLIRTVDVHDRAGNVVGTKEVVLYAGLLNQAHEEGLARLKTSILQIPTEENGRVAIVKAEVETSKGLFEAIGDACPENVDDFLAPHLIRVAETRAGRRHGLRLVCPRRGRVVPQGTPRRPKPGGRFSPTGLRRGLVRAEHG